MSFLKKDDSSENRQFSSHVRIVAREAFLVLAGVILLVFILLRFSTVRGILKTMEKSLQGVIFGLVIAYLLDPLVKVYRRGLEKLFFKSKRKKQLAKSVGIALGIFSGIAIFGAMLGLIIPSLVESITHLVNEVPGYIVKIQEALQKWLSDYPGLVEYLNQFTNSAMNNFATYVSGKIAEWSSEIMSTVGSGVVDFIKTIVNLLVGFVIAIYLLRDKSVALSKARKITYAILNKDRADYMMDVCHQAHQIFSGFIIGKLIDSLIIGIITAFFMIIMKMPYGVLISIIVGVTNIIPFFGPFIGAIPSALLILMYDPFKCLVFLIFILILQQIDGNIIGPRILGDRINLNEFWIVFAIMLFGGIFGFFGMVVGVPLFGVIYYIFAQFFDVLLKRKGLPLDPVSYRHIRSHREILTDPVALEKLRREEEEENGKRTVSQRGKTEIPDMETADVKTTDVETGKMEE